MTINIFELAKSEDKKIDIKFETSLSDLANPPYRSFQGDAKVFGFIENRTSVINLNLTVSFTLSGLCDSCGVSFSRDYVFDVDNVVLLSEAEDNDAFFCDADGLLNISQIAVSTVLLELPSKITCKSDCLGLCPSCGVNLNDDTCTCKTNYINPKFAALQDLFNRDSTDSGSSDNK